jgi:hypothetical protein
MDSMISTVLGISLTIRRIKKKVLPVVEDHCLRASDVLYVSFAPEGSFQSFSQYLSKVASGRLSEQWFSQLRDNLPSVLRRNIFHKP